ncbi:hypothetical protein [Streptomyces boninensis]|uniref:hypothetical protein n=1 Tax=Streptomyces boninensis TaxID=2039455 RepID=UPI003B224645
MIPAQQQTVQAVNGFAYGCVGADIHVFGDGVPLYVLQRRSRDARPDASWLLALPSRMLNSRFEVVGFSGRTKELDDLRRWRDHGPRLAVQWLHAPGGQGKSRLAAEFAKESEAAGWTVATAARGPGVAHPPPGSQDLRGGGSGAGVLLVVDYADRWPVAHLTWLLSNALLHRATEPARVLLLARSRDPWPAVRAAIADLHADASTRALPPLADAGRQAGESERHQMFVAARDAFAGLYGVPAHVIEPPGELRGPDFGLTLAVHVAALAAVDRHAHAATAAAAPPGMTGLTAYLLDRERRHWHTLHATGALGASTAELARAAFVASLTGPLPYREALQALDLAGLGADADRLLTGHAYCYPPGDSGTVLEPLYPDRLTEDFLALSLPGHQVPDHAADPWAAGVPELLLPAAEPTDAAADTDDGSGSGSSSSSGSVSEPDKDGGLPPYAPRALTFLTAASYRWPHLRPTLEALDARLPEDLAASEELAAAAADLAERLAPDRLAAASGPADTARLQRAFGKRLDQARRSAKAPAALAQAVRLYRELAASDPRAYESDFAEASLELAMALVFADLDQWSEDPLVNPGGDPDRADQAAAAFRDAIEVFRRLAAANPAEHQEHLAVALTVAPFLMPRLGPSDLAMTTALEAVGMLRRLADEDPGEWLDGLAYALVAAAGTLADGRPEQALALAAEGVGIARGLARDDPAQHLKDLVFALPTQAALLLRLEQGEAALDALSEAAGLSGGGQAGQAGQAGQSGQDADAWQSVMSHALSFVWVQERTTGASTGLGTAAAVLGGLARGDTAGRGPALLQALFAVLAMLEGSERTEDALAVRRDIVHLLKTSDEIPYAGGDLVGTSDVLGVLVEMSVRLARTGRWEEALTHLDEAAEELWAEGSGSRAASLGGALTNITTLLLDRDPGAPEDPYEQMADPDALRVLERIADTYHRLAQHDPAAHELGVAVTAKIRSQALGKLGRFQEAAAAGREAVRVWRRRIAREDNAENREQLALALRYLADKLSHTGEAEAAAAAAREAADLRYVLARDSPTHYPAAAAALFLVADNLRRLRPAEALRAAEESADLLRRFPSDNAAQNSSYLATVDGFMNELRQRTLD